MWAARTRENHRTWQWVTRQVARCQSFSAVLLEQYCQQQKRRNDGRTGSKKRKFSLVRSLLTHRYWQVMEIICTHIMLRVLEAEEGRVEREAKGSEFQNMVRR